MVFQKPPMLSGSPQQQIMALRDYLFRMADDLQTVSSGGNAVQVTGYDASGRQIVTGAGGASEEALKAIRKNAGELRDLIIKSASDLTAEIANGDNAVIDYTDSKTEEYNSIYLARSEFGDFTESISATIENTARGVVESYDYESAIASAQDSIGLLQNYYTSINGEIRRGIVLDPDTGDYVTGIAIAQALKFKAEISQAAEAYLPDDGYTYYEMNEGQTFGLYTSIGWQFWIDGHKKGFYSSLDQMLHVENIQVEQVLQVGGAWQLRSSANGAELEIYYAGT